MSPQKAENNSQNQSTETTQERYGIDQEGGFLQDAQTLVSETAGTVGANIANEQLKAFLTEYIPAVIVNVTNLYGPEIGGQLISKIQMICLNALTGDLGLKNAASPIIDALAEGTSGLLGLPQNAETTKEFRKLFESPMRFYWQRMGLRSLVPKVGQYVPGETGRQLGMVNMAMTAPANAVANAYKKSKEIYTAPFNELSLWMSKNYAQLVINTTRDPFLKTTFIPGLERVVDQMLPTRDLKANLDPLDTSKEHASDVAQQKVHGLIERYRNYKKDAPFLVSMALDIMEGVASSRELQQAVGKKVLGNAGETMVTGAQKAHDFIQDRNSLSAAIAEWMQGNFDTLVQKAPANKQADLRKHAELFKLAFSGNVLTKEQIDTIKGKWRITQAFENTIQGVFTAASDQLTESARRQAAQELEQISKAFKAQDVRALHGLLNHENPEVQMSMRYQILKNRLNLRDNETGLPISPLMYAIKYGSIDMVNLLMENCKVQSGGYGGKEELDIDIDQYSEGITPVQAAILFGKTEIAQYLIDRGADLSKPSVIGNATPLMIAAKQGNGAIVAHILNNPLGQGTLDLRGFRNRTALHYAMMEGHIEVGMQLLARGAELFVKDDNGMTPIGLCYKKLMMDVAEGQISKEEADNQFSRMLEGLKPYVQAQVNQKLENEADYPSLEPYLKLAIGLGCQLTENPRARVFSRLLERNEIKLINKLMHDPLNSGLIEREMRDTLHGRIENGVECLQVASAHINAVELNQKLIELAPPEVIASFITSLIQRNREETFPFELLDTMNQAVIDTIINRDDFAALGMDVQLAILNHQIKNNRAENVKRILEKEPQLLNAQDTLLNTPLHYSIKFGRYELTQTLLELGSDVNIKNRSNHTAYENWGGTSWGAWLLGPFRKYTQSIDDSEKLAQVFAGNLIEIRQHISIMEEKIRQAPDRRQDIVFETLSEWISKDASEVKRGIITQLIQRDECNYELFSRNKGTMDSLILQAIAKQDLEPFVAMLNVNLHKNPQNREGVCFHFMQELLSEKIPPSLESVVIKAMDIVLALPDKVDNNLLTVCDLEKGIPTPAEQAFANKKYKLMEFLLEKESSTINLNMMDHLLLNSDTNFARKIFDENAEKIADLLKMTSDDSENTIKYLQTICTKPDSEFKTRLLNTYFLNVSGAAINQFLDTSSGKFKVEDLFSKFNTEQKHQFIENQFKGLSPLRQMQLLEKMIEQNDIECVNHALEANPNLLNLQLPELKNRTPLHMAVHDQHWELANYLMVHGANVNVQNASEHSPYDNWYGAHAGGYMSAAMSYVITQKAEKWNTKSVEIMLAKGSDAEKHNAKERLEGNMLIMRCHHWQDIIAKMEDVNSGQMKIDIIADRIQIVLNNPREVGLGGISFADYIQATRNLITDLTSHYKIRLEDLFSYKLPGKNGNTLLHQTIEEGHELFVELVLDYPLENVMNLQNFAGDTPLHLAIRKGNYAVAEELIKRGAATDLANQQGETVVALVQRLRDTPAPSYLMSSLFRDQSQLKRENGNRLMRLIEDVNNLNALRVNQGNLGQELREVRAAGAEAEALDAEGTARRVMQ